MFLQQFERSRNARHNPWIGAKLLMMACAAYSRDYAEILECFSSLSVSKTAAGPGINQGVLQPEARDDSGMRPSCSSIERRSNIKLKETCLPSRKRSTWM